MTNEDFEIRNPSVIRACGALECDSNHCDKDPGKLCISYNGPDSRTNRWALAGRIFMTGKHKHVPFIEFQSAKLAGLFCTNLSAPKTFTPVNPVQLRKAIKNVLSLYGDSGIKWDLIVWGKFATKG